MLLCTAVNSSFVFARVTPARKRRVQCEAGKDVPFADVGLSFRGGLRRDEAGSNLSSPTTNRLNGVSRCRFNVRKGASVTIGTVVSSPRKLEPCCPIPSNFFRMLNNRRFLQAAAFSACHFFLRFGSSSKSHMLFKSNCLMHLTTSESLANFSLMKARNLVSTICEALPTSRTAFAATAPRIDRSWKNGRLSSFIWL